MQSRVTEGSVFAFFIPVQLSTLAAKHETIPGAAPIHHSLVGQTHARLASTSAITPHVAGITRSRRPSSNSAETGIIHILLVEDNEISQKLLKKQLVRAGCSVETANDGIEAVEFMLKNASNDHAISLEDTGMNHAKVELILMGKWASGRAGHLSLIQLDIEMPRKGGIEAAKDIRSMEASGLLTSRIPIIAVSANARSGQIESVSHFFLVSATPSSLCHLLPSLRC